MIQAGHLAAAGADRLQCGLERQCARGHECAVLADAVTHHHVRPDAVRGEQPGERQVAGHHGRLGDLGLQKLLLELGDRVLVVLVDEDVAGQRLAEQRRHDLVGLRERLRHDRLGVAQFAQHVDVLRALAGVEEGHLGCRAVADEDAAGAQHLQIAADPVDPGQRRRGAAGLVREFGRVAVVDGGPHLGRGEGGVGRPGFWCHALGGLLADPRQLRRPRPHRSRRPRQGRRAAAPWPSPRRIRRQPPAGRPWLLAGRGWSLAGPGWPPAARRLPPAVRPSPSRGCPRLRTSAVRVRRTCRGCTPPSPRGSWCRRNRTRSRRRAVRRTPGWATHAVRC